MKTVTLPIEEYEELVQDREDKKRLMAELEKNAEERGFLVRYITHVWRKVDKFGFDSGYQNLREKYTLEIVSKEKILADAQAEIERLASLSEELSAEVARLTDEKNRGFFARLFK